MSCTLYCAFVHRYLMVCGVCMYGVCMFVYGVCVVWCGVCGVSSVVLCGVVWCAAVCVCVCVGFVGRLGDRQCVRPAVVRSGWGCVRCGLCGVVWCLWCVALQCIYFIYKNHSPSNRRNCKLPVCAVLPPFDCIFPSVCLFFDLHCRYMFNSVSRVLQINNELNHTYIYISTYMMSCTLFCAFVHRCLMVCVVCVCMVCVCLCMVCVCAWCGVVCVVCQVWCGVVWCGVVCCGVCVCVLVSSGGWAIGNVSGQTWSGTVGDVCAVVYVVWCGVRGVSHCNVFTLFTQITRLPIGVIVNCQYVRHCFLSIFLCTITSLNMTAAPRAASPECRKQACVLCIDITPNRLAFNTNQNKGRSREGVNRIQKTRDRKTATTHTQKRNMRQRTQNKTKTRRQLVFLSASHSV